MKDYYSILQINENASIDIIEKVYKLLIKKYHPDLQKEENKLIAEEKMKEINEAYEVLSDLEKRKKYNEELKEYRMKEIIEQIKEKERLQDLSRKKEKETKNVMVETYYEKVDNNISDDEIRRQAQVYYDELYKQYLYRNGYIKDYKLIFKDYLAKVLAIIITILLVYAIIKIPYINNIVKNIFSENGIIKSFLESFRK